MIKGTKRLFSLILVLAVAASLITGCGIIKVNPAAKNDTTIAIVNGENIKKAEFDKTFEVFKVQYEQQYGADIWNQDMNGKKFLDVAKEQLLDKLIENKLQQKKAVEMGIKVTDEEVNTEISNARKYFDTEDKFNEFLKGQNMTLDFFKQTIKEDLINTKVKDALTKNVAVNDQDTKEYYDAHQDEFVKVKASHILLDTEEEAKKILERVKAGEDFGKLAKEFSKDPSAKTNGGDLGYFGPGTMVEPFESTAFSMKPGQISEIVNTQFVTSFI